MRHLFIPAVALALCLPACQQVDETNITMDTADGADIETLPPDDSAATPVQREEGAKESSSPGGLGMKKESSIPAKYHGRWGIGENDCAPDRIGAEGLIVVGPSSIKFYESVANLIEQRPAIATSFSGLFEFTGEGQSWQKVMTFTRTNGTLLRAEDNRRVTYKRCS